METHPMPIDFKNPSYENFMRHMDYREEIENATPSALKNEWKAMLMFLRAWGMEKQWNGYKAPFYPHNAEIVLPYPETRFTSFFTTNTQTINMKTNSISTSFL